MSGFPRFIAPPIPGPGVYYGMSNEAYHATAAIGKSDLDAIARTPAHWKYGERKETAAMLAGTALHCAVLEPECFERRYASQEEAHADAVLVGALDTVEDCRQAAKLFGIAGYSKLRKEELRAALREAGAPVLFHDEYVAELLAGRTALKPDDWELCLRVREAIQAHHAARELLAAGRAEVSAFWTDPETELPCKCRPDFVSDLGALVDVKKTVDAGPWAFARAVHAYRYHVQASYYLDGYSAASGKQYDDFAFITIEPEPPYAVAVYDLEPAALARGRELYRRNLNRFAECHAADAWPGYSQAIITLDLPPYAY